jgi:hypothetical protein
VTFVDFAPAVAGVNETVKLCVPDGSIDHGKSVFPSI